MVLGAGLSAASEAPRAHAIALDRPVLSAEEGLLLGNGDLSVSVYQTADAIVWRFGKGDVWDRRLDLSDCPKPTHIDELARGVEVEGWKCGPYGGPVEATKGSANPQRMKEICQGSSPSDVNRPYPCPKPVGELALHFPPDLPGLAIVQKLSIEEARLSIDCSWANGVKLHVEAFIPPKPNVLALRWKIENWNEATRMGRDLPPAWFSLYRWADPTVAEFAARQYTECRHGGALNSWTSPKITPLPPPAVRNDGETLLIEQSFYPDPLFKDGFRYLLAPFVSDGARIESLDTKTLREAHFHILPKPEATEGRLAVAVATSRDEGGPLEEIRRIRAQIGGNLPSATDRWAEDNRASAAAFWGQSAVAIADPLLENLWYETFHARRCAYRRGTVPPGLFLPSTVRDYSHWHGDYHTNYNIQEPFWGDYTANHLDLAEAYFDVINFFLPIGRKIAKDYYNCRGVFIQLSGYPILAEDDPIGVVPMGRMAYMTGWAMTQYWWRYLYTLDRKWLADVGYPVMRDCALFYTDFLKKRDDGLYHAFPSNQGEDGFSGNIADLMDRPQVILHMRYCLRAAVQASELLGADEDLRAQWRDRLDHSPGASALSGLEKACEEANPPEFSVGRPYKPQPEWTGQPPATQPGWYFGQMPWGVLSSLRNGSFVAERDLPGFRKQIESWRRPNGLIWGMAVANYGRAGAWTESLGVAAPLQEMMLQSWDGALRIFPAWPKNLDARFSGFRAEGAFLVSAAWSAGRVTSLEIRSEQGAACALYPLCPKGFRVADATGKEIPAAADAFGRTTFPTSPGMTYRVSPLY